MLPDLGEPIVSDRRPYTVLFVTDNGINESLPITELSSCLRERGFATRLLIERGDRRFLRTIEHVGADVLILPGDVTGQRWAPRMSRVLRARFSQPLVLVGTQVTMDPSFLEHTGAEIACRGECEEALPDLLDRLRDGADWRDLPNMAYRRNGVVAVNPFRPLIQNLDALPLPDRAIYYRYKYLRDFSTKRITAGRGCPNRCAYCYNPGLQDRYRQTGGRYTRRKSPERVIEEIRDLARVAPIRALYFIDDLFTYDEDWIERFCALYRPSLRYPFSVNATVGSLSERTVQALAAAGCYGLQIGVETGNDRHRREVLNKPVTNREIADAAALIHRHDMEVIAYNMVATPGDTEENVIDTIRLNRRIGSDHVRATFALPIAGARMAEIAVETGWMSVERMAAFANANRPEIPLIEVYDRHRDLQKRLARMLRLFTLFVHWRLPLRWLPRLARLPLDPLYAAVDILAGLVESKTIFRITWWSGFRLYAATGGPAKKTKNMNNFIP
jgi:radical SAM superfamily enzyme YgiQ (UPF0313 family)